MLKLDKRVLQLALLDDGKRRAISLDIDGAGAFGRGGALFAEDLAATLTQG